MINRSLVTVFIALVTCLSFAKGQDTSQTRSVAVYLVPLGFLEGVALGIQYQLDDQFAVGIKLCSAFLGGKGFILPPSGVGGGVKVSYYFHETGHRRFLNANVVNFEASYLKPLIDKNQRRTYHASEIELTIGHDGIQGVGFGFLWAFGVAFSSATSLPPLVFPALKLGVHYDF
jgi:hypothetical protein